MRRCLGGKEIVERMLSARRLTSLLSRSSTTTKAEVNGFGNRQKETKTLLTRRWREPDSNLYGAFPVKSYFWFVAGSLFGAGKPFFVPSLRSGSRSDDELRDGLFAYLGVWSCLSVCCDPRGARHWGTSSVVAPWVRICAGFQYGPEGPEVSTSAAWRSPAVRDQAKGQRVAGDPNLKLEARHGTDSSQTPRWREADSNHQSREAGNRRFGRMICCSR